VPQLTKIPEEDSTTTNSFYSSFSRTIWMSWHQNNQPFEILMLPHRQRIQCLLH